MLRNTQMSDYAVMREQARVCCNGLALHIRFRVDGVAHELAEGAVLFSALGEAGGVEGFLGLELAPGREPCGVEAAVFDGGQDGAARLCLVLAVAEAAACG